MLLWCFLWFVIQSQRFFIFFCLKFLFQCYFNYLFVSHIFRNSNELCLDIGFFIVSFLCLLTLLKNFKCASSLLLIKSFIPLSISFFLHQRLITYIVENSQQLLRKVVFLFIDNFLYNFNILLSVAFCFKYIFYTSITTIGILKCLLVFLAFLYFHLCKHIACL